MLFCCLCFTTDLHGAQGESLCSNCGANNSAIDIPDWAISGIRQQASWVGKRYYTHEEDRELAAELTLLRMKMPQKIEGRTAELLEDGNWFVTQKIRDGKTVMMSVTAESEEEALLKAKPHLPYVEEI